ncbi:MAG: ECF-type sigma factor [Bacteroidota bacterium]
MRQPPAPDSPPPEITHLLGQARSGDADALGRLIPMLYGELRGLAHRQRKRRGANDTLNTTALVHEAYEKLAIYHGDYADRHHFFRVAARVMRMVIIDHVRAQRAQKRGGGARPLPLDEVHLVLADPPEHVLALDEALQQLSRLDERQAEIVQLRYFAGLSIPETADAMQLSIATVNRSWAMARAWLHRTLADAE